MYKSLEELMAGIYEMAAPHGIGDATNLLI